jgi:ubiquinone/menaquinone biosynthesis C-methylase UbiE
LNKDKSVADIGSGTGILTKQFLDYGSDVFGVEPNRAMREAAEKNLECYPNFVSIDGTAEDTKLKSNSIDYIVAGQAFHWFDKKKVKEEFKRILKAFGWVVLIWNIRQIESSQFMRAYEDLLIKHASEYLTVSHKNMESEVIRDFYKPNTHELAFFPNMQHFDFVGLKGRLMSSSFVPKEGEGGYIPMLSDLSGIFANFEIDGKVNFEYRTEVYFGQINESKYNSKSV